MTPRRSAISCSYEARSSMEYLLCSTCDDYLYRWLYRDDVRLAAHVKQAANLLYNIAQAEIVSDANRASMRAISEALDEVTKALGGNPHTPAWANG